jgi:hypothetical protein
LHLLDWRPRVLIERTDSRESEVQPALQASCWGMLKYPTIRTQNGRLASWRSYL